MGPISDVERYDFQRLERAVAALAESRQRTVEENQLLRRELAEKNGHVGSLEERLLDANQRRQDVAKRVDELIAQIDQLDAQLSSLEKE